MGVHKQDGSRKVVVLMREKPETVLSVDLGGTKILIGEVDEQGNVLSCKRYRSDVSSQDNALKEIKQSINEYLVNETPQGNIKAVGISAVGRINMQTGDWLEIDPSNTHKIAMAKLISEAIDKPVFALNDVTSATIAENSLGIGNVTKNFIYINLGTGIAARIVDKGRVLVGNNYDAGEVGHMVVDMNSDVKCICGRYGCVEPVASGLGMSNQVKRLHDQYPQSLLKIDEQQRVPADAIFRAYDRDDPLAKVVVTTALKATANLVMNLVRVSDPQAVVFGGGVVNDGWFLKNLQPYLVKQTMRFVKDGVIMTKLDPNTVALKGAAMNAFQRMNKVSLN